MAQIVTTENPSTDVRRFLRHWAAESFVYDRLKDQHPGMPAEKRRTKARQIARLVHQGLDFLESADHSSTRTKPLTLFYGAENLAKAACICRDPVLGAEDIRFHGLGGERETKRNSIKNLACRVYEPSNDVWSHVFRDFNRDRFRFARREGLQSSIADHETVHLTPLLKPPAELQFGELLLHLPDVADDVELAEWGVSYMVRSDGLRVRSEPGSPEKMTVMFSLRHGHRQKVKDMILGCESTLLKGCTRDAERFDVFEYSGPENVNVPTIRADVFGEMYMDFCRSQRVIGELPTYLGALFILSDVVRYQAEHWLRLLTDHPAEEIVVERFLDIASRKFPNLILNELNQEIYEFKLAR